MTSENRLTRLLIFLQQDAQNLALRKDAIREACDAGECEMARVLLDDGLLSHPDEPELMALYGLLYLRTRSYADAERSLSSALLGGIEAAEVRYNRAFAVFMQGRYVEALDQLADPALAQAVPLTLLLRARCLHHLRRPDEAIAECRSHTEVVPAGSADAHGLLALLLHEQHRNDEAQQHIESAFEHSPQQLEALLALAEIRREAQHYDAAQSSFDKLVQLYPDCGRGWLGSGLVKLGHLHIEAARQDLERAAACMPGHLGTWHLLAWAHLMLGDISAAEQAFERAMELDRTFGETHGGLAVIAALRGREDAANASIKRALRLNPEGMSARYARILLLRRHGQHKEAQALFDAFMAGAVNGSDVLFRDVVSAHSKYLQKRAARASATTARH